MPKPPLSQTAGPTPLAQWLGRLADERGWTSGRQAAKYLKVNQATFATWFRGEFRPSAEHQRVLAEKTGESLERIAALAAASGATDDEAAAAELPRALVDQIADAVTERVVERLHEVLMPTGAEDMASALKRMGIANVDSLDDRIPVMFSGVIWEELTDSEKAGVIALAKRLMGRPHGRMGRRHRTPQ